MASTSSESGTPVQPLVLFGRPEGGPEVLTIPRLREDRDSLVAAVKRLHDRGGGVLVYAFAEEERRSALMVVQSALPRLRRLGDGGALQIASDPAELFIEPPAIGTGVSVFVFHFASRYPMLAEWVAEIPEGVVVLATGLHDEWERLGWTALFGNRVAELHRTRPDAPPGPWLAGVGRERRRLSQAEEGAQHMYEWVALLNAVGVPCPEPLLEAVAGLGLQEIEGAAWDHADLFHIVRTGRDARPAYVTGSEVLSDLIVRVLWPTRTDLVDRYLRLVSAASTRAGDASVRRAIVRALLGLAGRGHRDVLIELLGGNQDDVRAAVRALAEAGSPMEVLSWSKIHQEAYRFAEAAALLEHPREGMDERYRKHALATVYRRWAETTDVPSLRQARARTAVHVLEQMPPDANGRTRELTVHEQALALRLYDRDQAKYLLGDGLQGQGPANVYMLVSLADLLLESGRPSQAKRELDKASEALGTPAKPSADGRVQYVWHLLGRLRLAMIFEPGANAISAPAAFKEAAQCFFQILTVDPYNLPALTELGRISWQRGRRATADYWLARALRVDPGNLFALMSRGQVFQDAEEWSHAEYYFKRVLELNDRSIRACTALAALALRIGDLEPVDQWLARALAIEHRETGQNRAISASENAYILTISAERESKRGDNAAARARLERARDFADAHGDRADPAVLVAIARLSGDEELFRRAQERARDGCNYYDYVLTRNTWAEWKMDAGNVPEAVTLLEETRAFDPDNVHTLRLLARALRDCGEGGQAAEEEQRAAELEGELSE